MVYKEYTIPFLKFSVFYLIETVVRETVSVIT
jgi:hypothetical protein